MKLYGKTTGPGQNGSQCVRELLRKVLALETLPELRTNEYGKPYLPGGPQLSLSHTRGAVAAAIGTGPVGVDVERIRPIRADLPRRVLSPAEYGWFQARGQRPGDFFTLWTLKESYYKYLGTGLRGCPNGTEFYLEGETWHLRGTDLRFWTIKKGELLLALCGEEQLEEFSWNGSSGSGLPVR